MAASHHELNNLKLEDAVLLDEMGISEKKGESHINSCEDYFEMYGGPIQDLKIDEVMREAFNDLYGMACQLVPENLPKDSGYITAVRIYWGIDPEKKMIRPVYQPVCLILSSKGLYPDCWLNYTNEYSILNNTAQLQVYNSATAKFGSYTQGNFETTYYNTMKFIRKAGDPPQPFADTEDITGDVKSQVFTFQEIFAEMYINGKNSLFLYNSARRVQKRVAKLDLMKHVIYLSARDPFASAASLTTNAGGLQKASFKVMNAFFDGNTITMHTQRIEENMDLHKYNFADLAHLCPPNCSVFKFTME